MRFLIITQKVDINDPILGFFHRWVEEFAKHCENVIVICLEKGEHNLPENVRVLSLGKEEGKSRLEYIFRFFKYIWLERKNYDKVFVHMNQEYILLGGLIWKILGKKISMWRNHYAGDFLTNIAVFLSNTVFCTSKYSYTAKFKKTRLMPVGMDTEVFKPDSKISKIPNSILSLGRISPSKNIHLLIEAVKQLDIDFTLNIYGQADKDYLKNLKNKIEKYNLTDKVFFHGAVKNFETPKIYNRHQVFVNLSPDGMYDKTIFEAMACGCMILASNNDLKDEIDNSHIFSNKEDLASKLKSILYLNFTGRSNDFKKIIEKNDLNTLIKKILKWLN